MKAIIMAGGFGTRLRPLTSNIPKPMVPMANKPMMHHIVNLLKRHGFSEIVSLLFYQPEVIRNYFGDGGEFGINMQYMQADADYGTAGSVRNAQEKIGDESVIIISGDVLTDFDLTAALEFHKSKKADATLILTRVPNPLQYGVVMVDREGDITRFLEKPSWGEVFSDTINTGIYIIENHVLKMIPYREDYDFSKNLFPVMMQEKMKLCGYIASGYWRDVGNLNEYQEAAMDCIAGAVKLELDGERRGRAIVGINSDVPEAIVSSSSAMIGNNCRIAQSARIINSIIGDNVTIHDGAIIQNTVVWDNCTIEEIVQIANSVVGYDTVIHAGVTVADNVFISDGCDIGQGAVLKSNIKIWPGKIIEDGAMVLKSMVWEDKWLRELFTDARITGMTNVEINPEFGARLGAALGASIGKGRNILASRDSDTASRMIKRAIISGLMSSGANVLDMQTTVIPIIRQELRNGKCSAGFHVRKSPFDRRMIDIIFFDGDGTDLPSNRTKTIERQFFSEDFARASFEEIGWLGFPERSNESYIDRYFSVLDPAVLRARQMNVVIDYSFGIASTIFPNILGSLGAQVVSINAYLDPTRISRTTEQFHDARANVSRIVTSLSYEAGFLVDAGAEKLFVANGNGEFFSDDRLLSVITKLFFESCRSRGIGVSKIGVPVGATSEVKLIAEEYGADVVYSTNTHSGMMNLVRNDPEVMFVGGTRGGFIFPEFLFATDAMFNIAKILEMLSTTGLSLSAIDESIPRLHRACLKIPCSWDKKGRVMRHAMEFASNFDPILIDGIKMQFDPHHSVLLLPSKEESIFHVFVEARTPEGRDRMAYEYEEKVVHWRDNM
jgi:mannose-1-phosphate guanylyltransferase/phosphomannomutase